MQTQSHFLMTAVLRPALEKRGVTLHTKAFLLGSVLPDIPLFLLSIQFGALAAMGEHGANEELMAQYDWHFFNDPVWIVPHNFFHAPFILAVIFLLGLLLRKRGSPWGARLISLALAAGLHTGVDIFTHHSDGPLLLFPFDWRTRFASPISYWDPNHYGRVFRRFELALDVLLLGSLLWMWWRGRQVRRAAEAVSLSPGSD